MEIFFEYVSEFNAVPFKKAKYKGYGIGPWFQNQKIKITDSECVIYKQLSVNPIVKLHLNKYLEEKAKRPQIPKKSFEKKTNILFSYCTSNNKMPPRNLMIDCINISKWYAVQKEKIKDTNNNIYLILSQNNIVKKNLDAYLNRVKPLTFNESMNLLTAYCKETNSIPKSTTNYEGQNLGTWYIAHKTKIKNREDPLYIKMSKVAIVKKNLDEYLNREKTLTFNESMNLLIAYCGETNSVPKLSTYYRGQKLGRWYILHKTKINSREDAIYLKMSTVAVLKKNLDEYLDWKQTKQTKQNKTN